MQKKTLLISILLIFTFIGCKNNSIVEKSPIFTEEKTKEKFDFKGYHITPIGSFDITGKVLSTQRYLDPSHLTKYDILLGWKSMSNNENIDNLDLSQVGKSFIVKKWDNNKNTELNKEELDNFHIIFKDDEMRDKIGDLNKYEIVHLKGDLVKVESYSTRFQWEESIPRDINRKPKHKILYLEELNIIN